MFGPPIFVSMVNICLVSGMLLVFIFEKRQMMCYDMKDVKRCWQKKHSRQSGTNKFKFIFQQYMQLNISKH